MIIMLVVVCGNEHNNNHYPGVCRDVDDGNGEFGDNGNKFSVIYSCTPSTDLGAERLQRGQKAKTLRLCDGDVAFCPQLSLDSLKQISNPGPDSLLNCRG